MHYILFLWQDDWFIKYKQNQLVPTDKIMPCIERLTLTFKYHKYLASDSPRDNIVLCVPFVYHSDIKSNTTFTCRSVFFFSEPILLILPQTGLMTTSHGWNHPHLVPHAADTRKSIIPKYSARPQVICVYITSYTQYNHRLKF